MSTGTEGHGSPNGNSTGKSAGGGAIDQRLRDFISGQPIPVSVKAIPTELTSLWRGVSAAGGSKSMTRACLWTLIVRVPADAKARARRAIDAISPSVPARVLLLATRPDEETAPLRASVEANWHAAGGGTAQIGSEEITLEASGAAIDDLPPIVRALEPPDVPIASLWLGAPPQVGSALDCELRSGADRVILDGDGATAGAHPGAGLVALARFIADRRIGCSRPRPPEVADLAWLRAASVRQLVAGLFDHPTPRDEVSTIVRARISHRPDRIATALLVAGWLATRLGWSDGRASSGGTLHFRNAHGDAVTVTLHKDTHAPEPLGGVELNAAGGRYGIEIHGEAVRFNTPRLAWKEPCAPPSEGSLWLDALGALGRDPLYLAALEEIASVARAV